MQRFITRKIVPLLFALLFPALCVGAAQGDEILISRIDPPAQVERLGGGSPLLSAPAREDNGANAASAPRVRLEANDTLTALNFRNQAFFSPYIGAAIGHEEPPIHEPGQPQALTFRLGAGFGYSLDALTRFFFNYSFQFLPDPAPDAYTHLDDTHNISLGLQFTF